MFDQWAARNPQRLCYIIANATPDLDGQWMRLEDADENHHLTTGAVILLVPDKLAYYHTERSNINIEPFYLLLRP